MPWCETLLVNQYIQIFLKNIKFVFFIAWQHLAAKKYNPLSEPVERGTLQTQVRRSGADGSMAFLNLLFLFQRYDCF